MNKIWSTILSGAATRTVGYYVVGPIVALTLGPIVYGGFWKGLYGYLHKII